MSRRLPGDDGSSGGETGTPTALQGAPSVAPSARGSSSFDRIPIIVDRVQPTVVSVITDAGQGSGVIYRQDGFVITNQHVVGEASEGIVQLGRHLHWTDPDPGSDTGVLVDEVVQGGPAARAGLVRGDVIVRLDDRRLETIEDLFAELREHKPGEKVTLTVIRDGEERRIEVTLGDIPQG